MSDPSGTPSPGDSWRAVTPEPATGQQPPMPGWVKPALIGLVSLLLILGGVIGGLLGSRGAQPSPDPEPSPTLSPPFALEPPIQVDDFVRGQASNGSGTTPPDQHVAQADYADGTETVVFVMSWPEEDVAAFVERAGVTAVAETSLGSGRYCGLSEDAGGSACGEIVDDVGLLLVSLTGQPETAISDLLERFKEELGQ